MRACGSVRFIVPGVARPQGSKRHIGHGVMIESSRHVKRWRAVMRLAASEVMGCHPPLAEAVMVTATFSFQRPKSHYRSTGELKPSAPTWPTARYIGDIDKLERALYDAMTGVVYVDDSQVAKSAIEKVYATDGRPSVVVTVTPLR